MTDLPIIFAGTYQPTHAEVVLWNFIMAFVIFVICYIAFRVYNVWKLSHPSQKLPIKKLIIGIIVSVLGIGLYAIYKDVYIRNIRYNRCINRAVDYEDKSRCTRQQQESNI